MPDRLSVSEEAPLLPFLLSELQGWSRKKVKERLHGGCVQINGSVITQHNHMLQPGDTVEVLVPGKGEAPGKKAELEILYQDSTLIAIHKPAGLLAVAPTQRGGNHALSMLRRQIATRGRPIRLWPVHRLDRETSGVMLFTTSRPLREKISEDWSETEKTYLAIVEGYPSPREATIDQPLWLDPKTIHVHVGAHPKAKAACTRYQVLKRGKNRALLQVQILTGRQHQIRAHLAWIGHPVVGDSRYGTTGPRMALHALRLRLKHPQTGKELLLEASVPPMFEKLLGKEKGKR